MPVNDTSTPIPSPNEAFIDRYRRITPQWYPFIRRLFESLRTTIRTVDNTTEALDNLSTDVTEVIQVVDNIQGQWGIAVNANGRVTAAVRLDGSPAQSSFSILADRFIVVNPSNNGQTIQAFTSGLVNGVPTVGINGNLVVDDSITANQINVTSLEAISGTMGSLTTGRIQSPDGRLDINALGTDPYIRLTT